MHDEELETLARTLAVERLGATIRPRDYEVAATIASGIRTLEGALPSVSLGEPSAFVEPGEGSALEMVGVLGEGGMGRVLLARQGSLDREVAVKVLKSSAGASSARAMLHEGRILGSVAHPNVLPIHALGSDDAGQPALITKRIDGVAWRELILDPDHPFWSEVETLARDRLGAHLEILMHVAQAVQFAHERGVLHRDIKSENVIVGRFGEVCLADWGISVRKSALSAGGPPRIVGTPSHLAPEMARGDTASIDERTDVYLLGATLHEILTGGDGRHVEPHGAADGGGLLSALLRAIESAPVEHAASVPRPLADIENRATARAPDERYPSARAFREAIADYLRHASSVSLARAAEERQAELAALLAQAQAPLDAVYRLLSECRFGFAHAIREWPDNDEARRGLTESVTSVARFELASGRLAAARALVSEVATLDPELERALRVAEEREAAEDARTRELEHLERDMDLTLGARRYSTLFGTLGALGVVLGAVILVLRMRGYRLDPLGHTLISAAGLVALVTVVAVKRRVLFDRRASRGVVGLVIAIFTAVVVDRGAAVLAGASVDQMNVSNAALAGACCLAGAFLLRPWFAWLALLFFAVALVAPFSPGNAGLLFLGGAALATLFAAVFWRRDQRRGEAPGDDSVAGRR